MATTKTKPAAQKKTGAAAAASAPAKAKKPGYPKGAGAVRDYLELATLPEDAFGLSRAHGLGVTPRIEAFLGLGFPHMLATVEDALPDYETAQKVFGSSPSAPLRGVVPRELAARRYAMSRAVPDAAHLKQAFESPPKVTLDAAVKALVQHGTSVQLFALEAMFGSVAVAEAVVTAYAKAPIASWKEPLDRAGWNVLRGVGWLLLRVPTAQRTSLRGMLEETYERVAKTDAKGWRTAKALDVILHGRAGVERSGGRAGNQPSGKLFLSDLAYVDDDRDWLIDTVTRHLTTMKPADREHFDPQLVVQGGAPLLKAFRAETARFRAESRKSMDALLLLFRG